MSEPVRHRGIRVPPWVICHSFTMKFASVESMDAKRWSSTGPVNSIGFEKRSVLYTRVSTFVVMFGAGA